NHEQDILFVPHMVRVLHELIRGHAEQELAGRTTKRPNPFSEAHGILAEQPGSQLEAETRAPPLPTSPWLCADGRGLSRWPLPEAAGGHPGVVTDYQRRHVEDQGHDDHESCPYDGQ